MDNNRTTKVKLKTIIDYSCSCGLKEEVIVTYEKEHGLQFIAETTEKVTLEIQSPICLAIKCIQCRNKEYITIRQF